MQSTLDFSCALGVTPPIRYQSSPSLEELPPAEAKVILETDYGLSPFGNGDAFCRTLASEGADPHERCVGLTLSASILQT
jgi:hypothetical protein